MAGSIPREFIDTLLDRVDLVALVGEHVVLRKSGKNHMGCCPFHEEKTPSFSVSEEKQLYHCFGCKAGGNALDFVMAREGLEFPLAVERLAKTVGMEVPRAPGRPQQVDRRQPLYQILEDAAGFYREQLQGPAGQAARAYLQSRSLNSDIQKRFALGYSPTGMLLKRFGTDQAGRKLLLEAGLIAQNEGETEFYERFRARLMFPIRDPRGRVIAFGGRRLEQRSKAPKYLNSPETAVFRKGQVLYGLHEARRAGAVDRRLLVVEGYTDVISLAQHGFPYAVAALGTAVSRDHLEQILRQVAEVVFCMDADSAGQAAARRALKEILPLMKDGRQARFLLLPPDQDPDSVLRRDPQAFQRLLDQARPLSSFLFDSLIEEDGIRMDIPDGRARLVHLAVPLLRTLPGGVFREQMVRDLQERSGASGETLAPLLQKPPPPAPPASGGPEPPPPPDYDYDGEADWSRDRDGGREQGRGREGGRRSRRREREEWRGRRDWKNDRGRNWRDWRDETSTPEWQPPLEDHRLSLVQQAIALLMREPALATGTELERLPPEDDTSTDLGLFITLVRQVRSHPEASSGWLLGQWHGTSQYPTLLRLGGQCLTPAQGRQQEFADLMERLYRECQRQEVQRRLDAARKEPLQPAQQQRLKELLASRRHTAGQADASADQAGASASQTDTADPVDAEDTDDADQAGTTGQADTAS